MSSPNGFNSGVPLTRPAVLYGSSESNEKRHLIHTLRNSALALSQAIDALERVQGWQNESGTFYDLVSAFEANLISGALSKTKGHQRRAAQMLGLKASTFNAMIKRLKISV